MGEAMDLAFSPLNDKLVCTVGSDETMKLFDVIEKKSVKGVQVSFKASSCCFAPDGQAVAIGGMTGELAYFSLRTLTQPKIYFKGHGG